MTTTAQTTTQADLDAQTYAVYAGNGAGRLSKAEVARQLGINASTVTDRIKRHLARAEQDTLADSRALDAEQAEQDAEYAADSEAAEQAEAVFARIEASNPEARFMDETDAALAVSQPVTEDPDESLVALLEQGDPEEAAALAAVREEADQVRAMGSVPNPNEAHAVAIKLHANRKNGEPEDTEADPQLQAERDALMDQSCRGCGVEVDYDGAEIEHLDNCPDDPAFKIDADVAGILAAGAAGGLAAAAEQLGEVLANATEAPAIPAKAEKTLVTECVRCSFHFSRPQVRTTCQSDKACQRRQAAKVTA